MNGQMDECNYVSPLKFITHRFNSFVGRWIEKLWCYRDPIDESMGYSQFSLREMASFIPNIIIKNIRRLADVLHIAQSIHGWEPMCTIAMVCRAVHPCMHEQTQLRRNVDNHYQSYPFVCWPMDFKFGGLL
jgi:hypothetical protein